jgi:hypothetical protein
MDFLKPKIRYNSNIKAAKLNSLDVRVDRLVSSLAIASLVEKFQMKLPIVQFRSIIHCLVLGTSDSAAGKCDFDEIHKHFPEEMWGYVSIDI